MKKASNRIGAVIIGAIIILVGVGVAAKNMGYDFDVSSIFFDGWWTLFLIVPGVIGLFQKDSNKVFDIALIAVGVALLAGALFDLNIWSWVAAVAVIAVGVSMILRAFRKSDDKDDK